MVALCDMSFHVSGVVRRIRASISASQGEATAVAAGEVLKKKKKGRRGKGSHNAKEMKQKLERRVAGSGT